jgi:hypothetical protein
MNENDTHLRQVHAGRFALTDAAQAAVASTMVRSSPVTMPSIVQVDHLAHVRRVIRRDDELEERRRRRARGR